MIRIDFLHEHEISFNIGTKIIRGTQIYTIPACSQKLILKGCRIEESWRLFINNKGAGNNHENKN